MERQLRGDAVRVGERYLYRGVIQEKDIIACKGGFVTFRYQNSNTKKHCCPMKITPKLTLIG